MKITFILTIKSDYDFILAPAQLRIQCIRNWECAIKIDEIVLFAFSRTRYHIPALTDQQ